MKIVDKKYQELVLRNGYFINNKLQQKISETRLVFIGCGLASTLAISSARLGFTDFVLVDGDVVDRTNLNRQDFYVEDIGKNKAEVIAVRLKKINPEIKTQVIDKFIEDRDEVRSIISLGEIIINCSDFNKTAYYIDEIAAEQGKISISPLNIGFGTVVTVFNSNSVRLRDMTNGICKNDKEYLLKFYKSLKAYKLPNYLKKNLVKIFYFIARKGYFPQNVIAAQLSNASIMIAIIKYLDNKKIKIAPEPIYMDADIVT